VRLRHGGAGAVPMPEQGRHDRAPRRPRHALGPARLRQAAPERALAVLALGTLEEVVARRVGAEAPARRAQLGSAAAHRRAVRSRAPRLRAAVEPADRALAALAGPAARRAAQRVRRAAAAVRPAQLALLAA